MKKLVFLLFFQLFLITAHAQLIVKLGNDSSYKKNLEQEFANATNDSIAAYSALKLSQLYKRAGDTKKMQYYLSEGTARAKGNAFMEAAVHYYTAFSLFGGTDMTTIESHLHTGDSLLQRFNDPEAYRIRGNSWLVLGTLAQMQGDEPGGLDAYLNHALPLAERSGDRFLIANVNKFIGIVFLNAEERKKAESYLVRALAAFEQTSHETQPNKPEAIVEVTIILAENSVHLNQLDRAKVYLDKAKKLLDPYPQSNAYLFYYFPEGVYFERMGQYKQAIRSFDKGISMGGGNLENYYVNRMKYGKFETLLKIGDYPGAIRVMEDLLKSPILLPLDKRVYMEKLADAHAQTGNMREAYNWMQKNAAFRDSIYGANYQTSLIELEKKYEVAQKENEIITLEAEKRASDYAAKTARFNSLSWAIGCALLLAAVGFLVYFLRNSSKLAAQKELNHEQQVRELEQQQELAVTRAMLEGEERERQRIARDLHDGLGGALSGIKIKLSGQRETPVTPVVEEVIGQLEHSIGELRRIARNMMPESLVRSGLEVALRDLCVSLANAATDIEFQANGIRRTLAIAIQVNIYRIVQELLSNAIRHSQASRVIVQCLQEDDHFLITVEDNGRGFDTTAAKQAQGIGLNNIHNRVDYLKGSMEMDSAAGQGTTVNIELHV
ncbi:ATP-binding protein [Parapedobacter lycopersici]|uniref:tetratricopeptide repeat-containing sensor histidine kinase n=1 Tax=Parapedobacter lycopersici TaxID=1864939 RepID=UPI00333FFC56